MGRERSSLVGRVQRFVRSSDGLAVGAKEAPDAGGRDRTAEMVDAILRADINRLEGPGRGMETVV